MLSLLRHSRAVAMAMVLLAPGISGSAVQWMHACPAEAQAVPDHQHHGSESSQPSHQQGCDCIDSCNTATAVAPAKSVTSLAVLSEPGRPLVLPAGLSFVSAGTPFSDLLPPATAPPLV